MPMKKFFASFYCSKITCLKSLTSILLTFLTMMSSGVKIVSSLEVIKCFLLISSHVFAFSSNALALRVLQRNLEVQERNPAITAPLQKSNFCQLHEQVEKGSIEIRHALKDLHISIGAQDYVMDRTGKINEDYIAVRMLDEVAKRSQFKWRDTVEVVHPPSQNQTWTDVLNYTTSKYDLALDYWMRTMDRVSIGIMFPQEWYDTSMIMIQLSGNRSHAFSWLVFLPFTWAVWMLILLTMIITGLVYYAIDFIMHREHNETATISDSIYYSFQVLTGTSKYNPTLIPNRILLISLRFLCIVLVAAFRANLTAFLLQESTEVEIEVIEDAIHRNYRICVSRGTPDVLAIKAKYPTGRYIEKESQLQVYEAVHNGECDIGLGDLSSYQSFKNKIEYNPNCNIQWIGREITSTKASFGIKASEEYCTSFLREVLNLHLLEMYSDGTMKSIIKTEQDKKTNNCESDDQSTSLRLNITSMSGIFATYAIGIVIGFASSIILRAKHPKDLAITRAVSKRMSMSFLLTEDSDSDEKQDNETPLTLEDEKCDNLTPHEKMLQQLMIDLHAELKANLIEEFCNKTDLSHAKIVDE